MLAFDYRKNLLFAGIHARLSNVIVCRHDVGEILLFLQSRCGTRLLNLRICRFERRLVLRELLLHSGVVKFNQNVSLFNLRSVCRKLHDLQIARTVGRGDYHRAERLDLAFDFQVIDKFLALHIRGREFHCGASQTERPKSKATDDQSCYAGQGPLAGPPFLTLAIHCKPAPGSSSMAARRMISPSFSPETTTASRSFRGPICTARFSKLPVDLSHTKG